MPIIDTFPSNFDFLKFLRIISLIIQYNLQLNFSISDEATITDP